MSHQSDLISEDILAYLGQHERKELLRFLTCGNVDDGKSTLIGRLLHDSKMIYEDHLEAITRDSKKSGTSGDDIDLALLVFGIAALPGIWLTGLFVDRHLHRLSMASILLFCCAVLMLGLSWGGSSLALAALAVWGFAFGGSATLFQTSLAQVAGEQVDLAQSLLVTTWNSAIAGGGLAGGLLVVAWGAQAFQPVLLLLLGFAVVCQRLLSESSIKHLRVMQADYEN